MLSFLYPRGSDIRERSWSWYTRRERTNFLNFLYCPFFTNIYICVVHVFVLSYHGSLNYRNHRMMTIYSLHDYCVMYFIFDKYNGIALQIGREFVSPYFFFCIFFYCYALSGYISLDSFYVLTARILFLNSLCGGIRTPFIILGKSKCLNITF